MLAAAQKLDRSINTARLQPQPSALHPLAGLDVADAFSMISQLVVLAAAVAVAASQAAQYPAGVNPHLCPNYPHCDNALLALHAQGAANAPVHAPVYSPVAPNPYAVPSYVPNHLAAHGAPGHGAAQYPAGVSPQQCPNYPYCSNHVGAPGPVAAPPLPGFSARQYPDGVSPHACPNYPYCH